MTLAEHNREILSALMKLQLAGPSAAMAEDKLKIERIDARQPGFDEQLTALRARLSPAGNVVSDEGRQRTIDVFGEPLTPSEVVGRICQRVREQGMPALLEFSRLLDRAELSADSLRVSSDELAAAHSEAEPEFLQTVRQVRQNILEFQQQILHQDVTLRRDNGVELQQRYRPVERAGLCIPGGAAAYPSSLLMTAVPAQAAGVRELVVVAPPTPFGANNPDLLAVCAELGIDEVYRLGGAQAVATLAYGVEGILPVDIIVGPGNLFVALAKQLVFGEVAIDSIAGPSEVVLIADQTTRASYAAADMLAQAEHAPGASILVSWHEDTLDQVYQQLCQQVVHLSRSEVTVQSLEQFGALVLVDDAEHACQVTNLIAPEHLHIAAADAESLLEKIHSAGATFLGNFSPVAIGDYVAGPSHVLPTGGTARWASGLSANSFLRSGSVIRYNEAALAEDALHVRQLADKEGLTAHRASIDIRLEEG
jgi:histidinol dehydrogenase